MTTVARSAQRPAAAWRLAVKRAIDIVGSSVLLLLSAPVILLALMAVWMESGAPVIHRRRVVGRFGRQFDAYKVRTMVPDADARAVADESLRVAGAASAKVALDPRVTAVGRWLRRFSVDELPQLVNVLRGEMSLVGPRMVTVEELPAWGDTAALVLTVRPGMTGLWQVSGRQTLSRDDRIRLDGEYVRAMSIMRDLRILVRTVPAVLGGRGAL